MYRLATSMVAAGIWALALSAQAAPTQKFPGVPQFTAAPPVAAVGPEAEVALRQLLNSDGQRGTAVCSIPLLEVHVAKDVEQMPVLRQRADNIDRMSLVKPPTPPCEENKR
ncbi:MAG TPA: hypothetical protein VN924_03665 [Bryobacteraceae bacterium]|nr:hypothetical protein [Bryobacteraceae bacterium]